MKRTLFLLLLIICICGSEIFAVEPKKSEPPFEYSLTREGSKQHTTFIFEFSPVSDMKISATCILQQKKDRKLLGRFPLRKITNKDENGKEKIQFVVSCLATEMIPSARIELYVRSKDKSKRIGPYRFPLDAVK